MGEIGRPVQGVDIPTVGAFLSRHRRFFSNDLVCRKTRVQDVGDQRIGGFIDVGDEIDDIGFDLNGFGFEPIGPEQYPGLVSGLLGDS